MESHKSFRIRPFHAPCGNRCGKLRLGMPDPRKSRPSLNFIEASRIRFCGKYGPQAMASQAKLPVGRIKCGWPERAVSEPMITTARRRKPAWASCPKMRTEPKARILEAFSSFAETSRRDTGSAIDAPEQTSPPDHPFRPAGAPELLCGGAVVITEQTAQSLTTSHLPVRTADAFFRFEQRVPKPLMVALSVIMMDELSDGTTQRWLTEEDHPLQALALDRQNKPFDISVQIRRTVRQPNDVSSGVLEQLAKLRSELPVAVQDEESLAAQKAVEWVGEIPTDLHHERAIWPRSDSGNVYLQAQYNGVGPDLY